MTETSLAQPAFPTPLPNVSHSNYLLLTLVVPAQSLTQSADTVFADLSLFPTGM